MNPASTINSIDKLTPNSLMDIAVMRANLSDFGAENFIEPLTILTEAMRTEANLSTFGLESQSERLINALVNRLKRVSFVQSHPEILNEQVTVAALIVGLPRTGSTMLQRLLASAPSFTATYWWETIYPMPLDLDCPNDQDQRISLAKALVDQTLQAAENFDSIHPLDAAAYDEELTLIEHSFMSNIPESMMYLPSYGKWLLNTDQTWAYQELIEYLQILQYQNPERRQQKWILKSPHHLTALPVVLKSFPEAQIIMTHRTITDVMPSWYSMVGSLTKANTTDLGVERKQAEHWTWRLDQNMQTFMAIRKDNEERFIDVSYRALLQNPAAECDQIFKSNKAALTHQDREAFSQHIASNKRDQRPPHKYRLEDFGITAAELETRFSYYTLG